MTGPEIEPTDAARREVLEAMSHILLRDSMSKLAAYLLKPNPELLALATVHDDRVRLTAQIAAHVNSLPDYLKPAQVASQIPDVVGTYEKARPAALIAHVPKSQPTIPPEDVDALLSKLNEAHRLTHEIAHTRSGSVSGEKAEKAARLISAVRNGLSPHRTSDTTTDDNAASDPA